MQDRKLYRVTVEMTYYVVADDEDDAESYIDEAMRDVDLSDTSMVFEVHRGNRPVGGWDLDCLVYGEHDGDLTLRDAMDAYATANPLEAK